ncbi:MAG TPA: TonB family protein [Candidatus Krumholzibacteria bacterium]|nr:TonB family protein [Candidatus Krumholzibacteria bacterium]
MAVVRLGYAAAGRFPRWGYLDKFDTNVVMPRAFIATSLTFILITASVVGYNKFQEYRRGKQVHTATRRPVRVLTAAEIGVPPSLMQTQTTAVKVEVKTQPKVAMPVPVPDEEAVEETIATTEEMSAGSSNLGLALGSSDSLVIDAGDIGLPSPDDYVAFEKAPELVKIDPVVYPDIAREAGVEGTVMVRVLVGDDGFVKDMIIIQSVPMLDESAADAAWTAVFKPALQKDRPVAVWMVIPLEFKMHE